MSTTFNFSKKYVLVTGSTAGIGRAIAELFVVSGATVAVHGRGKEKVEAVASELNKLGKGKAVAVVGDLGEADDVESMIEQTDRHGDLDILVNNAAVQEEGSVETQKEDAFRGLIEANVISVFTLCKHYLPRLLKKKDGRIINISSGAGLVPIPAYLGYSVSKSALDGLTRNLAASTAGTKVTVTSVAVGVTQTEGAERIAGGKDNYKNSFARMAEAGTYLGRVIQPSEIAAVVAFLASDAGVLVNGASQRADGGFLKQ